jgi:hypothetical protein
MSMAVIGVAGGGAAADKAVGEISLATATLAVYFPTSIEFTAPVGGAIVTVVNVALKVDGSLSTAVGATAGEKEIFPSSGSAY